MIVSERLYGLVEAYAALGDHRTGTDVDQATRSWFAGELASLGALVDEVPYPFSRYDASSHVVLDDRVIPSEPLFYAGVGEVDAGRPAVLDLEFSGGYRPGDVNRLVADAAAEGHDAVLLATQSFGGRLVALNRTVHDRSPILAALVPGAEGAALRQGRVAAHLEGRLVDGRSATVVGRLGPTADLSSPVIVTTPLTGWFACAGERGTGIAVALAVGAALAETRPVVVVGTTGHELEHLGGRHFLQQHPELADRSRAVIHLGAGAGVMSDGGAPPALRLALTSAPPERHGALQSAVVSAGFTLLAAPDPWPGEGADWARPDVPVLSFICAFERAHTRDDVPASVTGAEALATTFDAVLAAARCISA